VAWAFGFEVLNLSLQVFFLFGWGHPDIAELLPLFFSLLSEHLLHLMNVVHVSSCGCDGMSDFSLLWPSLQDKRASLLLLAGFAVWYKYLSNVLCFIRWH
jgi:hypothetical protein